MSKELKTDIPGIYKSSEGFLINKDNNGLNAYKARKARERELSEMKKEVSELKDDITEIKEMLKKVLK